MYKIIRGIFNKYISKNQNSKKILEYGQNELTFYILKYCSFLATKKENLIRNYLDIIKIKKSYFKMYNVS